MALGDGRGQRRVGVVMGAVLLAGEEADEAPSPAARPVADRPGEHRVARFEGVEDGALGRLPGKLEGNLALDAGEEAELRGQDDPDQLAATSSEQIAGRSRATAVQWSPSSAET